MASNSEMFVKVIVVLFAAGGGLLYSGLKRRARARLIEDTPRSKLATAPQGLVEVEGFAWPDGEKTLPSVSGFDVVYYEFAIQKQVTKGSGKSRRREWVTKFSRKHDEIFYVCDPTGLAMVDPKEADLELAEAKKTTWQALSPEKRERVFALIGNESKPLGFPPTDSFFGFLSGQFRIVEKEIRVGSPLHVAGELNSLSDPPLKITERGLTRFVNQTMSSQTRELKNLDRLLDRNGDSVVSSHEARAGYSAAAHLSRAKAKLEPTEETGFELWGLFQKSSNHRLFIADDHERRLVEKLQSSTWLRIGSGIACLTLAICLVLLSFIPFRELIAMPQFKKTSTDWKNERYEPSIAETMVRLHGSCLTGHERWACIELLRNQKKFDLDENYFSIYREEACRKAFDKYCNERHPAESKP